MALAIDGSSPAVGTGAPTATTASFTPPANSVLLIGGCFDSPATFVPRQPPNITDNLGTHLDYTLIEWQSHADSPNVVGQAAVWVAYSGSAVARTISVTNNVPGFNASIKVWVITGTDPTTPIGAHGKAGATGGATSISQNYIAQVTNGWGFLVACDDDATGTTTAGTGCTVDNTATFGFTYTYARRTTADDNVGSTNTLAVTLPSGSFDLNWVFAEVVPAPGTPLPDKTQPQQLWHFQPPGLKSPMGRFHPLWPADDSSPVSLDQNVVVAGIATNETLGNVVTTQFVAPVGIATNEQLGAATTAQALVPQPIQSGEQLGQPAISYTTSPTGVGSSEQFGVVVSTLNVTSSGIQTTEQFGKLAIGQSVAPNSEQTNEAFGTPTISATASIVPIGVSGAEQFGQLRVDQTVFPKSIQTIETCGNPSIFNVVTVSPIGIPTLEIFGTTATTPGAVSILPTGTNTQEIWGSSTVSPGAVALTPNGANSQETFGNPLISNVVTIAPTGIPTNERYGNGRVDLNIAPTGISTDERFANPVTQLFVLPAGIPSEEKCGSPSISNVVTISPQAIPSTEQIGQCSISSTLNIIGVPTGEVFGRPSVSPGAVVLSPYGVGSAESFGNISQIQDILLSPRGITSDEKSGTPSLSQTLGLTGNQSGEVFGRPTISTGAVTVIVSSIISAEIFGESTRIRLGQEVNAYGFFIPERFGSFNIFRAPDVESSVFSQPINTDTANPTKQFDTSNKVVQTDDANAQVKSSFAVPVV